jgi:hypothetical protein
MELIMATRRAQANMKLTPATFATIPLPLEPITVRIPVAVQLTGIGRSKLYQLIAAGEVETVKVGASTLVSVASLRQLVATRRR